MCEVLYKEKMFPSTNRYKSEKYETNLYQRPNTKYRDFVRQVSLPRSWDKESDRTSLYEIK